MLARRAHEKDRTNHLRLIWLPNTFLNIKEHFFVVKIEFFYNIFNQTFISEFPEHL